MGSDVKGVVIIGGGPAGLMAADVVSAAGVAVDVYDAMPSVGRKFLLAGKGGLNLTHSDSAEVFAERFGAARPHVAPWLAQFGAARVREWAAGLGVETFVGTSGRVFPVEKKAAPLLRAWLRRLRAQGVQIHARHRWQGWSADGALRFATPDGERVVPAAATVLALGGASWPRLGSDGAWVPWLAERGVALAPLQPANCGFEIAWSDYLRERFAGSPLKSIALSFEGRTRRGECVITTHGIEGGLVYAFSAALRDAIAREGSATLHLDVLPDWPAERVVRALAAGRGARSMASFLRSQLRLTGPKAALLHEVLGADAMRDPVRLAATIKALPLVLQAPRPIDEAISSAGGVRFDALDDGLMLRAVPGVFCAGEMLDWEAPTGGYLLTACLASGRVAGAACLAWRAQHGEAAPAKASIDR